MVEDLFANKVKSEFAVRRRVETANGTELEKLFLNIRNLVSEFRRKNSTDLRIGVFEGDRSVGFV